MEQAIIRKIGPQYIDSDTSQLNKRYERNKDLLFERECILLSLRNRREKIIHMIRWSYSNDEEIILKDQLKECKKEIAKNKKLACRLYSRMAYYKKAIEDRMSIKYKLSNLQSI